MKDNHRWNGNQDCYCNKQDVEEYGHCEPTNDCECCDSQSTIDSELIDILWGLTTVGGGMDDFGAMDKKWQEEQVTAAAQTITNLIAQEANKARLETMQKVSDRLDDLHQGTEGAGWVHYGEMGEWLDDEISRLTAEKGQA